MESIQFNNTNHRLCLVQSTGELSDINLTDTIGLNIETTGFDYAKDKIVGVNIATKEGNVITSYYIPLRHTKGVNVDTAQTYRMVQDIIDTKKVFMYNRDFVFSFLENEGVTCDLNRTHDAQIMLYLCTNKPCPTRNQYAHLFFPDVAIYEIDLRDSDFSQHNPDVAYIYAAQKTVLTLMLAQKVWEDYPMIHKIYGLDNESNETVRWLCKHTELPYSKNIVRNELDNVNSKIDNIKYVLRGRGHAEDLDNPMQRLRLVQSVLGAVESLSDYVVKNSTHPIVSLVKQYGELSVYKTTLEKLLNYDKPLKIHYSTVTAATGRLTSGAVKGNTYFNDFNIQAVEKNDVVRYVHKTDDGIGFTIDDNPDGAVKSVKCKGGLRDAFVCPDGYVWVSCDYGGEEMVLAADFSKDENLIEPIREGKDIHRHIAETMFGTGDDESRSRIKQLNFSVIYGATEYSIAKRLEIKIEECRELLNRYFGHLGKLAAWRDRMIERAHKNGYVCTLFGRPRMLFEMYQNGDNGSADRCACNSPIQGCTPLFGHLETEHSAVRMGSVVGKHLKDAHGQTIIPSHRSDGEPLFCLFRSGDYLICDENHSLVYGNRKSPKVTSVRDGLRKGRVWLAELRKKQWSFDRFFFKPLSDCAALFVLMCKRDVEIKDDNKTLNSALFRLALGRRWFSADLEASASLRSVASIFGYNVVYNGRTDKFRVAFFRRRKTRIKNIFWCFKTGGRKVEMGSCTKITNMQMYDNQGFVNKNTGADIIRIDLCKFKRLFDTDDDWRQNVRFACTIHDECNFYVRREYLETAVKKIYDTMLFTHPLMELPIKGVVSVGSDWGHLMEIDVNNVKDNIVLI